MKRKQPSAPSSSCSPSLPSLPVDAKYHVLSFLTPDDMFACKWVNRSMSETAGDYLWQLTEFDMCRSSKTDKWFKGSDVESITFVNALMQCLNPEVVKKLDMGSLKLPKTLPGQTMFRPTRLFFCESVTLDDIMATSWINFSYVEFFIGVCSGKLVQRMPRLEKLYIHDEYDFS